MTKTMAEQHARTGQAQDYKNNQKKNNNPHLTLSISQGNATKGGSVLMNITGQID